MNRSKVWQSLQVFQDDVDRLGGLEAVAHQSDISLNTIEEWYNGKRIPHWLSRPGIAYSMGFSPERYLG